MKAVSDYTDKELIELGKKAVAAKVKEAARTQERAAIVKQLMAEYNAGRIKLPGA